MADTNRPARPRPPMGPKPRWLCDEDRLAELAAAVVRYHADSRRPHIPQQWLAEMADILDRRLGAHRLTVRVASKCRWWLRCRPASGAVQLGRADFAPVQEFYVPWWAWPLEWLHRLIYGKARLER